MYSYLFLCTYYLGFLNVSLFVKLHRLKDEDLIRAARIFQDWPGLEFMNYWGVLWPILHSFSFFLNIPYIFWKYFWKGRSGFVWIDQDVSELAEIGIYLLCYLVFITRKNWETRLSRSKILMKSVMQVFLYLKLRDPCPWAWALSLHVSYVVHLALDTDKRIEVWSRPSYSCIYTQIFSPKKLVFPP